MSITLGVVMDPIGAISYKKDSTLAMLLAAQARGWKLAYMEMHHLFLRDGRAQATMHDLTVHRDENRWFEMGPARTAALADLDVLMMRKDPPFDMEFVQATYMLERAEKEGLMVVNKPASLRDCNEKMFTAWFPQCCPPTLVTREHSRLKDFLAEHEDIVVKPMDGMGGTSIFRVTRGESNVNVIFETLTEHQSRFAMAQRYIPAVVEGDTRILMIDGKPLDYGLARVPAKDDLRGNLAAGATPVGRELGDRDRWLAAQVGPALRERGLVFVGLDVIGDYLTEINVTSPTCIRELDDQFGLDIGGQLMSSIADKLGKAG
jgi:glutathione synthase